jgi:hypothetical protein
MYLSVFVQTVILMTALETWLKGNVLTVGKTGPMLRKD